MKKNVFLLLTYIICSFVAGAQEVPDSVGVLDAVTVTGIKKQTLRHTPFNVVVTSARQLHEGVNLSISDALAKLPGISQITTGSGISKPVIRGLYGNRIQTVLLGLRFDNQQWQDEHGLGLSIFGVDRIEILKGPSSLLYGTEAMGGVINIIEEKIPEAGMKESDVSGAVFSNTLGASVNAGIKKNDGHMNWRIRLGSDSHGDYAGGKGDRVLNSRFQTFNLKASLGYLHRKWINQNNFYSSFSQFGFIMHDNQDRKPVDSRISRRFDGPYHAVLFNILSSENTFYLKNSVVQINGGAHSNLRLENEGGNHISLNMLLNTFSYNAKWQKKTGSTEWVLGNESQYQANTNYGARVIIPDAHLFESALSAYFIKRWKNCDFETGLSVSERNIATAYTQNMDYSSGAIYPFNRWYTSFNGNVGISMNTATGWNLKINESTGYRSPNLAELSSNGLHEGTFRYEIGDPEMKPEQNLNSEIGINYESERLDLYTSVYLNLFRHYIYLAPAGTQLYGFDMYRFYQGDARLYGSEISLHLKPSKKIALGSSFSTVKGKLYNRKYLPLIPADKLITEIVLKPSSAWTVITGMDQVFEQDHPGDFETSTSGYWLLHASIGRKLTRKGRDMSIDLSGENLLDKAYYDHLSRFKYFGIYNTGRNVELRVVYRVRKNLKNNDQ